MNDTLQIIVTVLGILSQVLLLGRQFFGKEGPQNQTGGPATTSTAFVRVRWQSRSLLDLSFVLVCSAFFALLLTDSLIISGKNPSPGPGTILVVFTITAVVVVTMCGAWFLGKTELVTGFLAATTFIVLIISRGGPFVSSESDATAALSLLVPVVSLVTLASAMFIYSFGNPLSRVVSKRNRLGVSLALTGLVIVATSALGEQLVQNVASNARAPKINTADAKNLLQHLMTANLRERREFYRLASEANLARVYGAYYRQVLPTQPSGQSSRPDTGKAPGPPTNSSPSPTKGNAGADAQAGARPPTNARPAAGPSTQPSPQPSVPPKADLRWSADQIEAMKELVNQAYREEDYARATTLQQALRQMQSATVTLRDEGVGRVKFLADCFMAADAVARENYMTYRLEWIHPVGLDSQSEAVIQLPGTTSEQRFENTSVLRIVKALHDQSNKRQEMIAEFNYPDAVLNFFRAEDKISTGFSVPNEDLYKPTLFPKPESTTTMDSRLQEQLSLPRKEEAFLAYKEYKQLASLMLKQDLAGKMDTAEIDNLSATFIGLDDAAQDAFRSYVIDNKKIGSEQVYKILLALKEIDFGALAESQDPLAVEKLSSMLSGNHLADSPSLQQLADQIGTKVEGKDEKNTLSELLRNESPEVPIRRLFQKSVFDLVSQLHRYLGQDKSVFFDAVADPVWLVVRHAARTHVAQLAAKAPNEQFPLEAYLEDFRKLPEDAQGGILLQLAISLYQPGGPYSLDPARLLISQAMSWSDRAALLCASLIALPVLLLGVLAGGFFSRKLVARDRTRELIAEELTETPSSEITLGRPVNLHGRDEALNNLRSLAERGWSTIGVVGRRGVGKSRILYALSKESTNDSSAPTVRVWVSSPSKFQEEDFIQSIFERLALSAEGAIGSFLGAKPLSIRKIESRTALLGSMFYTAALVVLAVVVYEMYNRLTRADIVVTWLPILALVCASVWLFFSHLARLQPVDLSSWLQRDRTHNSHTVILYREVYDVLRLLRRRSRDFSETFAPRRGLIKVLALTLIGIVFVVAIFALFVLIGDGLRVPTGYYVTAIATAVSSLVGWIYLYRRQDDERGSTYGSGLMSLIADYRSFVNSMVYRLRQGALGHRPEQKFPVLICIDELDKVVDFAEIRAFVRRIKAIFEVPGVYYYVSLAEDTLTALYLGPAEGKNEIDSAFDHIVRIPPLDCDAGEAVASEYLVSHGLTELPPNVARVLSTVSFGVPRDIIRRCDELFTARDGKLVRATDLLVELRTTQLNMGYELKQLSRGQVVTLERGYAESAAQARGSFESISNPVEQRLILYVWLLCLVEGAVNLLKGQEWLETTRVICDVGYRLPTDSISDLHGEIEEIHVTVLGREVIGKAASLP